MAEHLPAGIRLQRLPDGRQLAWRQTGQGPPLVLLHGWSMSGSVFSEVADALSTDFQVFCPDLCGHGWSDPATDYGLGMMADDLNAWLTGMDLSEVSLLGWSLGGQVAMQLSLQNSSRIKRLLLVSTTPCFSKREGWAHGLPQTQIRTMARQLQRSYLKTLGEFFDLQFAEESLAPARRREILAFAARASRLPQQQDCISTLNVLGREDLRKRIGAIEVPVLVMHGEKDRIIPCSAGQYLASEIADVQLHLLENVGHAPFISRPEQVVEIWKRFLT